MTLSTCKKLVVLFLAANGYILAANAQIQVGIKGGLNVSELATSKDQTVLIGNSPEVVRNFPRTDVNAGLIVSIPLSKKFSFQPEAVFSSQGATAKPSYGYIVSTQEEYKLGYVNIPLLLKYNSPLGFFFETGPQVGLLTSAKINETIVGADHTAIYNVKNQFKSTDIGWTLGTGYLSPIDLGLDIRYNFGLTDINNTSASGMEGAPVQSGHIKNGVLQIGLFYLFGKSGLQSGRKETE